jgi:capsular polysaccharide transport system permease protein
MMITQNKYLIRPRKSVVFIGASTLVVWLYLVFLAAPTYRSQAKLVIRNAKEPVQVGMSGVIGMLSGAREGALEDAYILIDYLQRPELIESLDEELGIRAHYSAPTYDLIRRLGRSASKEDLYAYFKSKVKLVVSPDSGIITLDVYAFDPVFAETLARLMCEKSEAAMNTLNDRVLLATTVLAEQILDEKRDELTDKRQQLLEFQVANQFVNAENSIGLRLSNLSQLDSGILDLKASFKTKIQFLREDSFELKALSQSIRGLEAQRAEESSMLFNAEYSGLASAMHKYEALKLEADFSLNAYTAALVATEQAKLDRLQQEKFLISVAQPYLPEEADYPRPLRTSLTAFFIILLAYGIFRLVIATIRDHTV